MGDADQISQSVKRTQEELGRFVKKPPLTEKNLSRPPFRFLHDIVKNVIDTTGFMEGVFTKEELDAANLVSRDAKTAFMQKLIESIKDKSGEDVSLQVSKVLAGLEADKTNGLLQSLAKSIELHQQDGGGGTPAKKPTKKSPSTRSTPATKPTAPAAVVPSTAKKTGAKSSSDKKEPTKRTIRDASPASKPAAKKYSSGGEQISTTRMKGGKGSKIAASSKPTEVPEVPSVPESLVNDETINNEDAAPSSGSLTRRNSNDLQRKKGLEGGFGEDVDSGQFGGTTTTSTVAGLDDDIDNNNDDLINNANYDKGEELDNFGASVVKSNMQTLPTPNTPIMTDADAVNATMELSNKSLTPTLMPTSPMVGRGGSGRPPTGTGGPKSLSREASAEQKGSFGSASIGEVRPPTGQQIRSRPDTGTSGGRLPSARPPSAAHRAPPRPKSSVVKEDAEPYRPTTGQVAHVIMDSTEDLDDDNYVVREITVTASKPPGLSDLDETPELNLGGGGGFGGMAGFGGMSGEQLDDILPPDQRGLLVHQILETQKELEDKKGSEDTPIIERKLKELSLAEVEKLKNLIQLCARSANPLAKLLDYMAEDVDAMQKEYNNYREESKRLGLELENSKSDTEKYLQNLKHELNEIERKIKDKEDAILTSQIKIIHQEERIEEIVSGFEWVRSGKSAAALKDHMPPAEEILAHIQGQSSSLVGGVSSFGLGGGGPSSSAFSFTGGGRLGSSTPSSAASESIRGGGPAVPQQESFKIPDSFMVSSAGSGGNISSPFNRGRMWSSTNNNNNSATFDMSRNSMDDDHDDQPGITSMPRRNVGRSGASSGLGGMVMDVDNFNPWS